MYLACDAGFAPFRFLDRPASCCRFSYDCDTVTNTNYQFELAQKNLGVQLGGVIFSEFQA
jgi:hypothetical protein